MRKKLTILSILSGTLLALPWHEYFPGLIIAVAFVPLLYIEDFFYSTNDKSSFYELFRFSFLTFLFWNIISTYWLVYSGFFAATIVILSNTVAMSITFGLFHLVKKQFGKKIGYFSLIIFWISFEYIFLNTHLTWPWLNIGNAFAKDLMLIQWYEFTGVLGGSFWVFLLNISFYHITKAIFPYKTKKLVLQKSSLFIIILFIPIVWSLSLYYSYKENGKEINISVIQPNLDAYTEKYVLPQKEQTKIILDLVKSEISKNNDYIICPETSINEPIWEHELEEDSTIQEIRNILLQYPNTTFIIGASTKQKSLQYKDTIPALKFDSNLNLYYQNYNASLHIDTSDHIAIYYKSKLVSGVETMPFLWLFGFLDKLTFDFGGTTGSLGFQKHREVFHHSIDSIKIAPVICYESAFGSFVGDFIQKGASLITITTNDGWWGDSPGYKQHLRLSQIRAIENRRCIARSANTGISAFINPHGEITKFINYNKKGAISATLKTNHTKTFYSNYGDYLGRISLFTSLLIVLYLIVKLKLKK